jgi:hypothetical protein
MKWPCQMYAIWLNKRELQELRAAINTARDSCGYTRCSGVLSQIRSHLKPETRIDNELSVRAWWVAERNAGGNKESVRRAIESGGAKGWRNCGKKTIAELSAWCGISTLNPCVLPPAAPAGREQPVVGGPND